MGLWEDIKSHTKEKHQLNLLSVEDKKFYLLAVAFFIAIDEAITQDKKDKFEELIDSLDSHDLKDELFEFLDTPNADVFEDVFNFLNIRNYFEIYMEDILKIAENMNEKDNDFINFISEKYNIFLDNKVWKDPDTGLIWQVQIENKTYGWYETQQYVDKLNKTRYGGYNQWKIPTIDELKTILTKDSLKNKYSITKKTYVKEPLLNSMTMEYQFFWSSTINENNLTEAYDVYFYDGTYDISSTDNEDYIICVVNLQ